MHRGWNRWALVFVLGMAALICADGSVGAGVKKKENVGEKKGEKNDAPQSIDGTKILAVKEELTDKDVRDPDAKDCYCKIYKIKMKAGKKYQIDLRSSDFDAYLTLRNKDGAKVAEDDDGGGGLDSRIVFPATADAEYKIYASTFEKDKTGKFSLTVIEGAGDKPVAAAPDKPIPLKLDVTKSGSSITVNGELTNTDPKDKEGKHSKVYTVELQGGKRYAIYMKGAAQLDAFVRLEDAAGKLVLEDEFGEPGESGIKYTPDKTASFRIVATTYKGGADNTGKYTLSVTQEEPKAVAGTTLTFQKGQPTVVKGTIANTDPKDDKGKHFKTYAFEATAGKTYKFEMVGLGGLDPLTRVADSTGATVTDEDGSDGTVSRLSFTAKKSGALKLVASTFKAGMTGNYTLTASEQGTALPPVVVSKAEPLTVPAGKLVTVSGKLTSADPKDGKGMYFKAYSFPAQAGKTYRVELVGLGGLDPEVRLEDANAIPLAKADFSNGKLSRLTISPSKANTFRVIVSTFKAGMTGDYTLTITDAVTKSPAVVAMPPFQKVTVAEVVAQLTEDDGIDKEGKRYKVYVLKAQPGKLYRVEMNGRTFDALLRLEDDKGNKIKEEDFFDGRFSQLFVPPGKGGVFHVIATSADAKQMGAFSLAITEVQPRQPDVEAITFERISRLNGKLSIQDGIDAQGKFYKAYNLKTQPGMSYRCEMTGAGFDAVLRLEDEKGNIVKNEDFGDGKVSRLAYKADKAANLRLIASTFKAGQVGEYTLTIAESDKDVPATKAPKEKKDKSAKALPLAFENGKAMVNGSLNDKDAKDVQGKFFKAYALPPGKTYNVVLTGKGGFGPFVLIDDGAGKLVKEEDFGDDKVSRLTFTAPKTGEFRVIATSFKAGVTGDYALFVFELDTKKTIAPKVNKGPAGKPFKLDNGKDTFDDALTAKDGVDAEKKHFKAYAFKAEKGKTYRFSITGKGGLDPLVRVEDADGKTLKDEDYGDGKVSQVFFTPAQTGPCRVVASSYKGGMTGEFSFKSEEVEIKQAKAEPLKFDMGAAVASSELTETDAMLPTGAKFYKEYTFQGAAGKMYKIDLHSKDFDAYLYLKDAAGKTLTENDDNGDSLDSRIVWKAEKAGTFHIVATSLKGWSTGKFVLTVAEPSAAEKLIARAEDMLRLTPAERKQTVADLQKHFAGLGAKLNQKDLIVAGRAGIDLESVDKPLAAEAYAGFGKLFAASNDANVARQGKALAGAGKRLSLVGNVMEVKGATIDGKEFDLSKLKGKVVLVDFWATWCPPCKAELPRIKKLYEKYHGQGFEVIGISLDETKTDLTGFLDKEKLPWTSIFEHANDLADDYGVFSIPLSILVGRDGRVISLEAQGADLDRLLEEALAKKSGAKK